MWDFVYNLAWTVAAFDVASITYYACHWYGGPIAAIHGIYAGGPEVVPLLTMGALAPFQALRLRSDLQSNFDKIQQHIKMRKFEDSVSQWKGTEPTSDCSGQTYSSLDDKTFKPIDDHWQNEKDKKIEAPITVIRGPDSSSSPESSEDGSVLSSSD